MQKKQRSHGIIWFRNNLRITDNYALSMAAGECGRLTAVYFFDPRQYVQTRWGFPKTGNHRLKFLLESLAALQGELKDLNIPFHIEIERPEVRFPELVKLWKADCIYTQAEWTSEEAKVNGEIRKKLTIPLKEEYDQFLIHPDHAPFNDLKDIPEVFTVFRKACEEKWKVLPPLPAIGKQKALENPPEINTELPTPEELGLQQPEEDARTAFPFSGGTVEARGRLDYYFWESGKLGYYKRTRNGMCGSDYSSKLSPWLANGSISARTIYREVKKFERERIKNQDTYWLIFELLWRDYFKYISLKHGNSIFKKEGIKDRKYQWLEEPEVFKNWTMGRTGNDFVDANMIELRRTGWMSNRGRQNVASYLTKDLMQDWRMGAAWFESLLLDYDVHSNWGNWMYASGTGNDPRDRKFNTKLQAERYDQNGTFRKLWLQTTLF